MTLERGHRVLGRYVVEKLLGQGAMGQVYLARHELLDMHVAVKVLLSDDHEELRERFAREAKLMARVRHANVVQILDYGFLDDGEPCIVMEFLDGKELAEARRPAPWRRAVECVTQILEGLQAVHGAGVLHRDLKPSNVVMIGPRGTVAKLVDFGIARPASRGEMRLTQTGMLIGTPAFMSPEQLLGADGIGEATDVYSSGLILYELLQGALPFGDSMNAIMKRLRHDIPAPVPPEPRRAWPEGVTEVVLEMLAAEAGARPTTAQAIRRLQAITAEATAVAPGGGAGILRGVGKSRRTTSPHGTERPRHTTSPREVSTPRSAPSVVEHDVDPRGETLVGQGGRGGASALSRTVAAAPRSTPSPEPAHTHASVTSTPSGGVIAPMELDEERVRAVVVVKLPSSRLRSREDRAWLGALLGERGRGFTMGAQLWIAIVREHADHAALELTASVVSQIEARYGHMAEADAGLVGEDFSLTGATLSGAAPLPPELASLIEGLHG